MTQREGIGSSKATWRAWDDLYRRQPRAWRGPAEETEFDGDSGIVLELGCGSGKTLRSLSGHGSVIALDVSLSALKSCRRERIHENTHLVQGNATLLPFADASIDIIVAHHVLGHLMAGERVASAVEIARVLKPNRLLSIRAMSRGDMRFGNGMEVEPMTFAKSGIVCHFFDEDEVKALFPSFDVVRIETTSVARRYGGVERKRSEVVALLRSPA
ncbi:MAG: class I SAM-dependent methyltransferase [Methanomassiliicoccales archaeon]|nr:class I SAM-dependent methyltransferase [Methanomassiliicoccales archaeon]